MTFTHSDQLDLLHGMIEDHPDAHGVLDLKVRDVMYLMSQNVSQQTIMKTAEYELMKEGGTGMTALQILERYATTYADLNRCAKGEAQ